MALPKTIRPQTLNALSKEHYETAKTIIDSHNDLINALGPGASISPSSFTMSPGLGTGATVTGTSGSVKRGKFMLTIGVAPVANPTIMLNLPRGQFSGVPFATVVKNGGTGTLPITYLEGPSGVTITILGTPTAGHTYMFNHLVQD